MKFWDSSAVVPLLMQESSTERFGEVYAGDARMIVWWATEAECAAALSRREREISGAGGQAVAQAFIRLDELGRHWSEIAPVGEVRATARRLLRTHWLRAADALQLAAALIACEGKPEMMEFVCADERLIAAARLEGLTIIAPEVE